VAHFRSARAGRIRVFVRQLAPVCHRRRGFAFAARKGRNALRLPVRIRRHGRYELIGRARRHEIFRMRIGHGKSVCTALRTPTAVIPVAATIPAPTQPHEGTKGATHEQRNAASKTVDSSPSIASPLVRAVSLRDAPASIRPLLFVLLALSICFLGAAAMPQTMLPAGPVAAVVAQRRIYLAAAGIWLLAVVVFVTIVS
jgi:hypothetical protein